MKLVVSKNHLGGQILYRSRNFVKNGVIDNDMIQKERYKNDLEILFMLGLPG